MASLRASAVKYASGTIISQALIVIATPVMTRLYAPAAFGELALFSSLYGILIHFTTLKLELSILLPKERDTAVNSSVLGLWIAVAFTVLLGAMLLGDRAYQGLSWHYFFLPCALLAGAVFSLAQLWCSREKDFLHIGLGNLINAAVNVGFCIGFFFVRPSSDILVIGYTLGLVAGAVYLAAIKWSVVRVVTAKFNALGFEKLRHMFTEGRSFPLYVLPNMLLTSLAYQLVPLLMVHYFSDSVVGVYSVANRLLYLPSILVAGAFADIFRSELMTRMHRGGDPVNFFRKSLGGLLLFVTFAYLMLWLLSPFLFRFFLGENFATAGHYARYLCAGVAGNLIVTSFSYVFIAAQATRISLFLQIASTAATVTGFWLGAIHHDIDAALLFMSHFSAAMA